HKIGLKVCVRVCEWGQTMISLGCDFGCSFNLGLNDQNIALHLNPRFDVWGDKDTIVLNSVEKGKWKAEVQPGGFCFFRGESFKIIIKFKCKGFSITLPNGSRITVPNCIYANKYSYFRFDCDVSISSVEIR
uniref:Galectin n=1 Tax=Oryzias latipes TaxID=8090 RepID=A0A3P9MC42_ORYLA